MEWIFNQFGYSLPFRLIIGLLNLPIFFVKKSVTCSQSERHAHEKENYVGIEASFPDGVGTALALLLICELAVILPKIPDRDAAVSDAKGTKTVED